MVPLLAISGKTVRNHITNSFARLEVSERLRKDYSNGRSYYPLHGQPLRLPPHHHEQRLFEDEYVCVVRRRHPLVTSRLTLARYLEIKRRGLL